MRPILSALPIIAVFCAPLLATAGEPATPADMAKLVKLLGDDKYSVREKATRDLRKLGTAARAALEQGVKSKDPEIRERASRLLRAIIWKLSPKLAGRLGDFSERFAKYVEAPEGTKLRLLSDLRGRAPVAAEPYILQAAREETSHYAQSWMVELLSIYRSAAAEKAVLAASRREDRYCRSRAAAALARFEGKKATARLVGMVIDDDPTVRSAALNSLGRRGPLAAPAAPAVIKRLADVEGTVRGAAARAAGSIGDRKALEALWKLTGAGESSVGTRARAIEAIGRLATPDEKRVVTKLVKLLDDPLPAVRSTALRTLVEMRARSALPRLGKLLDDGDPDIASEAASALGVLGGAQARKSLRRALAGAKSESVRIAAGNALLFMGDRESAPKVAKMMFGRNANTASVAARALGMTGELKWAGELVKAEKHWKTESFRLASLEVRAVNLREPAALKLLAAHIKTQDDYARASVLRDRALFTEAAELIAKTSRTEIDQPRTLSQVGLFEVLAARGGQGLAKLRMAARMAPFDAVIANNLAWFLLVGPEGKLRRPVEALRIAERAARLEPRTGYILDTHAWALFRNGRKKEALALTEEAIRWAPLDRWPRLGDPAGVDVLRVHRARILTALGRREEALKELAGALARHPRSPEMAVEAARAYCDLGLTRKALGELGRMLNLGRPALETLRLDPELAPVRKDPDFKKLLERATADRKKVKAMLGGPAAEKLRPRGPDAGAIPRIDDAFEQLEQGGGGGAECHLSRR